MKAVGIDLTNAICRISLGNSSSWLPTVILPLVPDEPVLAGEACGKHRRGAGLAWPPECQIPYGNSEVLGKGRVTLAEVWRYLASFETQNKAWDNYQPHQRQVYWQPNPCDESSKVALSAEDVVYEAIHGVSPSWEGVGNVCLVVPDDMGEGAQQALLDKCTSIPKPHLLPRPVAISSHWCDQQKADDFEVVEQETGKCGFIWVLSMGLDRWEFCPVEIWKSENTLIPVRDHTVHSSGLAVDGLSMLAAYGIAAKKTTLNRAWFDLVVGDLAVALNDDALDCSVDEFERACSKVKEWPGKLSTTIGDLPFKLDFIREKIRSAWRDFRPKDFHGLFNRQDADCLGVVADGSLAHLRIDGDPLAKYVLRPLDYDVDVSNGVATFKGAELVAKQMAQGEPTYRDRIAPILIYYQGRDEFSDPIIAKKVLIEATTVEAGKIAKTSEPIKEFSILADRDTLELKLARDFGDSREIREVRAVLSEKTLKQERVEIMAEIRPGQGFATAHILSEEPGLFETNLNWRTMEKCEEPDQPEYAWPPGVADIRSTVSHWELRKYQEICGLLAGFDLRRKLSRKVAGFKERAHLHIWTLRDQDPLPYQYDGKIASSDSFKRFVEPSVLKDFSNNLGSAIALAPHNQDLIRLAGWLYEACPKQAIKVVSQRIRDREEFTCDLEVAGKAFVSKKNIGLFAKVFVERITALNCDYRLDRSNNWMRAFRDMIRFRVDTLNRKFITDQQINIIERYIIEKMDYESTTLGGKYDNCLYIAPHLLKRRRFDESFLEVESERWRVWMKMFKYASRNGAYRQKGMAKAMIRVLEKKATMRDIKILASHEK
jgi:hypothetical protein